MRQSPISTAPNEARPDPADVGARLRRCIAEHDCERRLNQRLIQLLVARNIFLGQVASRLRKVAAERECAAEVYDVSGERYRRTRRAERLEGLRASKPTPMARAA